LYFPNRVREITRVGPSQNFSFIWLGERGHDSVCDRIDQVVDAVAATALSARTFNSKFGKVLCGQWRDCCGKPGWKSDRNAFKMRIKTQTVLPSADTAALLFWALLASGQINMRKVDGWQTLAATQQGDQPIDLAAWLGTLEMPEIASTNSNTIRDGTVSSI
jgi:hypothetical protein